MNFYTNVDVLGNKIFLRGIKDGQLTKETIDHKPELYIRTNDPQKAVAVDMWKNPLERIVFNDTKEMKSFVEGYKDIQGFSVYGSDSVMNQYVAKNYPNTISYNPEEIRVGIVDIETFSGDLDELGNPVEGPFPEPNSADYPISMITLYCYHDKTYYTWGLETFKGKKLGTYIHDKNHPRVGHLNVVYRGFDDEHSLLMAYVEAWAKFELHAYSGWFIEGFDNPYLTNRIEKVCGETAKKKLSPWGIVKEKTTTSDWGDELTQYEYLGVQMLDYLALFKKHGFMNPDDTKLGTVAEMILGEGKIDYSEEGSINTMYIRNFQKCVEYNIIDVDLIVQMNRKKKFFELTFVLAYMTKSNFKDTLKTVVPWSALSFSMLYDQGIMPKIKGVYQGNTDFGGGFVREVKQGRYKWLVSFDLNSLYPHLIQMYNLGPETIIEPDDLPKEIRDLINFTMDDLVNKRVDLSVLKKYNICMTPNRQFFRRDKMSMYSAKTRELYDMRKKVKKEMLGKEQQLTDLEVKAALETVNAILNEMMETLGTEISFMDVYQHSLKILMNSLFGALGNKYMRDFFDIRIAEGITTGGKLSILWITRKLDEYFNRIMGTGEAVHKIHHTFKPAETRLEVVSGHNFAFYQDTDSCYLDLTLFVNKFFTPEQQINEKEKIINFLDTICKNKIEPYVDDCYKELADYVNAEHRMFMKREVIAMDCIVAGAKKYTMLVADSEGVRFYPKLKHKIVGLDSVRASFPRFCREWMKEAYKIAMVGTEEEFHEFVKSKKKEFYNTSIDKISSVTSVNNIAKYSDKDTMYIKGSPSQVKASIWHNKLVEKFNLNVPMINSGDKIRTVGLITPNPYNITKIAFKGTLPTEFGLHPFINYDSNWEKNFISPMNNLIRIIGWTTEQQASLMSWFD